MKIFPPDITALARLIGRSDADDYAEQAVNLRRIQELRAAMTEEPTAGLGWCLEAAATLADHLARPGGVPREALMKVVLQLVAIVEKGYGELLASAAADAASELELTEVAPGLELVSEPVMEGGLDVNPSTGHPLPLINDMVLGEILVRIGSVDREQVTRALRLQVKEGDRIGRALVRMAACNAGQVQSALRLQRHLRASSGFGGANAETSPLRRTNQDALLGEILVQLGTISPEQMEQALEVQRASGIRIGEALVQLGAARWTDVESAVRTQNELRFVSGLDASDRSVA